MVQLGISHCSLFKIMKSEMERGSGGSRDVIKTYFTQGWDYKCFWNLCSKGHRFISILMMSLLAARSFHTASHAVAIRADVRLYKLWLC